MLDCSQHSILQRERGREGERGQSHWAEADPHTLSEPHAPILIDLRQQHWGAYRSHTNMLGLWTRLLDKLWTNVSGIFWKERSSYQVAVSLWEQFGVSGVSLQTSADSCLWLTKALPRSPAAFGCNLKSDSSPSWELVVVKPSSLECEARL